MKQLICSIIIAISPAITWAGDFIPYRVEEIKLVFTPHRYPGPDSYTRKPVRVIISTNGQIPTAVKLRSGWTKFELTPQDMKLLGCCSFEECGFYAGPSRKPTHFFFHFHRVDRKGKKSPVTIQFTKGLPAEISFR